MKPFDITLCVLFRNGTGHHNAIAAFQCRRVLRLLDGFRSGNGRSCAFHIRFRTLGLYLFRLTESFGYGFLYRRHPHQTGEISLVRGRHARVLGIGRHQEKQEHHGSHGSNVLQPHRLQPDGDFAACHRLAFSCSRFGLSFGNRTRHLDGQ